MKASNSWQEKPILKVKNLTVSQGNYVAVDCVSFDIFPGSNTAIIGPNGAGKSTLIQAILGLIPFQSGEVQFLDSSLKTLGKRYQLLGYIPQKLQFDRSFPITVGELVSLGLPKSWFFKRRKRQIAVQSALVKVNLENQAKQPIGTLSGGELKRVLLAYCLVVPRQLLILDEAMAEVDAKGQAEFSQLLKKLQQDLGFAILQISHDLDMVSRHCDRVLCLNRHICCQGEPSQTLSSENLEAVYGSSLTRYFHSC
ncbi:MAG: metal ABC transporter ATP-binding protein [Microcoleaceae cyanobacterium]